MREILEGIFTWSRLSEPHGYDFNGYFIRAPAGNLAIDPVEPEAADLDWLAGEGVSRVLLTNRNHSRAANKLRARTGARTAIHPDDAEHARSQGCEIDEDLEIGGRVTPLRVLSGAGKSPGEVVLHWPERRLLLVGDVVIGNPPGKCGLLPEEKMDDPARLRATVKRLLDLDFAILLVGDGTPILEDARARLEELTATFLD